MAHEFSRGHVLVIPAILLIGRRLQAKVGRRIQQMPKRSHGVGAEEMRFDATPRRTSSCCPAIGKTARDWQHGGTWPPVSRMESALNPNILVVDDSATVRNVLKTYLTNLKAGCVEAEDATRALQLLHAHPVNLIIADINMPGMDGISFVRELRNHAPLHLRDMPVVLITAEKGSDLRQRGVEAGANAFLQKPVSHDDLCKVISSLLPGIFPGV